MGILSSLDASQQIITPREALFRSQPQDPNGDLDRKYGSGMSRGGSITSMPANQHWKRNETLLAALWNGCFDRAYFDFCASRLTDFTCVFWTDARVIETMYKDSEAQAFEDIMKNLDEKELSQNLDELDNFNFKISDFSAPQSPQSEVLASSVCNAVRFKESLIDANYQLTQKIVFPMLLACGIIGNILITRILYRLGRQQLPVCLYAAIITGLDLLILILRAGDLWIQALTDKSPTILFLLIHQSMCQVTTFTYSCLTHFHAFVYIAMAIDNWRLVRTPKYFFPIHTRAWVRHACLLMLALVLTLNAQFLWTFAIVRQNLTSKKERGFVCLFAEKFSEEQFRDYVWPIVDFVVADYLPGAIVAFLTIWSLYILIRDKNNAEDKTPETRKTRVRINEAAANNDQQRTQPESDQPLSDSRVNSSAQQLKRRTTNPGGGLREYVVDVPLFCGMRRAVIASCIFYLLLHTPQNVYYAFKYHHFRIEVERERATDPVRMFTSDTLRRQRSLERLALQKKWDPFYMSFEFAAQMCVFVDYSLKFLIYVILVTSIRKRFFNAIITPFRLCRKTCRVSKNCFRRKQQSDEENARVRINEHSNCCNPNEVNVLLNSSGGLNTKDDN